MFEEITNDPVLIALGLVFICVSLFTSYNSFQAFFFHAAPEARTKLWLYGILGYLNEDNFVPTGQVYRRRTLWGCAVSIVIVGVAMLYDFVIGS